jgi:prolyl oligopeptidase
MERRNFPMWWMTVLMLALTIPQRSDAAARTYPATPRDSVVDDYHGTRVADPYRWLENLDSPRTTEWSRAESRLTRDDLVGIADRDSIRNRLTALANYSRTGVPWREAGKLFFTENSGLLHQPVLYAADGPDDPPRVVIDPQQISPDGAIAIRDFAVSPDGRWIAYSSSPGGADIGETHVRSLTTGRDHADVVRGTWSTVCWTQDGNGFFYMRPPSPQPGQAAAAARLEKQLLYHRLGTSQVQDRLIHEWKDARWLYSMLSDDGRRLIVVIERGSNSSMYMLDLIDPLAPDVTTPLVPLLRHAVARHTPMGTVADTLYAWTTLRAPHGRVISINLKEGLDAEPRTIVAESTLVIQNATVAGHRLAVHYLQDVKSRLRLFSLAGESMGQVELPGIGGVGWALNGRGSMGELWYSFTSFLSPETVYRYDLGDGRSKPFRPPIVPFDPSAYETRQMFCASKDGTRVPMFITARKDLSRDAPNPTFLTAYGGYGIITGPDYRFDLPLWLEMGGIYVVATIRGGGEYGEEWHRNGSLDRKQNSFDDFIGAAQYLIGHHYTAPAKLAIYGHSNGGLLVGAVMTERPDLFGAAIGNAGHYDMLRYQKFTVGAGWIPEYGSSDDAAQFRYLRAYSPLHNVRAGTCYPATLLLTGDHDDRVVPSHSYKFAAALQAAQNCDRPILLRVASDASHSYASEAGTIEEFADVWAFVARQLGVRMSARAPGH